MIYDYRTEVTEMKFVPMNKQSKKAQRVHNVGQRGTWGAINPVTRTVPNGKAYDRNKEKRFVISNVIQ